jgi:transcriptional regulator with XRE-family HTH domain
MSAIDVLSAHRIRQRRLELALSEADAARGMGVSRSRLRAIERGLLRPSAKEIASIAATLRLSILDLFLALGNSR